MNIENIEYFKYLLKFLPLAAIGTIMHEFGHWLCAVFQGSRAIISYGFTHLIDPLTNEFQYFIFIIGGPISTWLTSIIGLLLLILYFRKRLSDQEYKMSGGHQISFFATLFCSRAVFNTSMWVVEKYLLNSGVGNSDEEKISVYLGWPPEILLFGGLIIVIIIILFSLFYLIPKSQRKLILITGIIGSLAGYVIWYYLLGPIILPVPS
ncbi:MAG: hypothetical protein GF329_00375 [Candidatus Lokiarchaeota archaeon]|nr:hypothetical protein [Candidatus Lokiarchaeota archaeon]